MVDQISPSYRHLLAVNQSEWRNLIQVGDIRISKRRIARTSYMPTEKEMFRVFALAPTTKIGSSVDLFVLELSADWPIKCLKHDAHPSEVVWLSVSDVISHHPVAKKDFEYFSTSAEKCGVQLASADFETQWRQWVESEKISISCKLADELQKLLGFEQSLTTKRIDGYKWRDVSKLVINPATRVKQNPRHLELLLHSVNGIMHNAMGSKDFKAFQIACAVEWINIKLKRNIMMRKEVRDFLEPHIALTKDMPIEASDSSTAMALDFLKERFPRVFTDEVTPLAISSIVELVYDSKNERIKPDRILRIFRDSDHGVLTSSLLAFLVSSALDPALGRQLVRSFSSVNLIEIDWSREI